MVLCKLHFNIGIILQLNTVIQGIVSCFKVGPVFLHFGPGTHGHMPSKRGNLNRFHFKVGPLFGQSGFKSNTAFTYTDFSYDYLRISKP